MSHFGYFVVERCELHDRLNECYDHMLSDELKAQVEDVEAVVLEWLSGQQFD